MPTLKHITCTGIDDFTDLHALESLQKKYPLAEFGILLSAEHKSNNRFPDLAVLDIISRVGLNLNLSLHLCRGLAIQALHDDWSLAENILGDRMRLFRRIQLNVSGGKDWAEHVSNEMHVTIPDGIDEVIVQQRDPDHCRQFLKVAAEEPRVSVLLDASGGRGVFGTPRPLDAQYKTGFAGGLNPQNVAGYVKEIQSLPNVGDYWIDAESGLRTKDDFFSIELAKQYIKAALIVNQRR